MTTQTKPFSLNNLSVFERPDATIEPRDDKDHAGCWVRFNNGWTISVQWGNGNYSSNYGDFGSAPSDSETAEVAAWKDDFANMVEWGEQEDGEGVLPYCSMERVQRILDLAAEDNLTRMYQPPTPAPVLRAVDDWTDDEQQ